MGFCRLAKDLTKQWKSVQISNIGCAWVYDCVGCAHERTNSFMAGYRGATNMTAENAADMDA